MRILEYSENFAKVYYVSKNRSGGNVLSFKKENGKWKYNNWEETVWSATGSASEVIGRIGGILFTEGFNTNINVIKFE